MKTNDNNGKTECDTKNKIQLLEENENIRSRITLILKGKMHGVELRNFEMENSKQKIKITGISY